MKILAIDGNSLINRAFYGIRLLSTKDGRFTNAITGFLNILLKLTDLENPDGIVVAWDLKAPTFRHKMYDEYKAGRKHMPPELFQQMAPLKEILCAYGCVCIEKEGFEADDILGTIAEICEKSGNECVIATGDRDSLQLVSDKTKVLLSTTRAGQPEIIAHTPETIMEKYGVSPLGLIEIKALQGDSSDNIPGVAGVGEKTAGDLISRFGNIDFIFENIDTLDIKENLKNKLLSGKDSAYLSRELGTIIKNVPISLDAESYLLKERNSAELSRMLYSFELFKLASRLGVEGTPAPETNTKTAEFKAVEKLPLKDTVSVVFEENKFAFCENGQILVTENLDLIKEILSASVKKSVYNYKAVCSFAIKQGIVINNVIFDPLIAAYLLNPSASDYSLARLSAEYSAAEVIIEGEAEINAAKCSLLTRILTAETENRNLEKLLAEIELPLSAVLSLMEHEGFSVDGEKIEQYGKVLEQKCNALQDEIYRAAGTEFNINSPKQLGVVLFETLGLPAKKKTKSGYSTKAEILEEMQYEYPIVKDILRFRHLSKLKSTFCDGLLSCIEQDGRIRSNLNQTETRTGRISSTEPNLQNIPVKTDEGKEIRKFFTAKDGFMLIDADYSQIELRVLAHCSGDQNMINAFLNGTDIHTVTASQVFNMPENMVTPLMRSRTKAVNFGIVYGMGAFSLSKEIGVTRKEADDYIKGYLATYPGVQKYLDNAVETAKQNGYCSTVFGRIRLLPELTSSNKMLASFGERVAKNMPIQGTAADIIKIAMIKVTNRLKAELPDAKLIMQIHDELIVEAPEQSAEKAKEILIEEMENAVKLSVPLKVDGAIGKTWYEAKL